VGASWRARLEEPFVLEQASEIGDAGLGRRRARHRLRRGSELVAALDRPTVPQPLGTRVDDGADLVFVIDVSGSTLSTDPTGVRFTAARRIVNLLIDGIGGVIADDRVGVVLFADQARPWLPLTSIGSRMGRQQVRQVLRPVGGGGTAIVPSLQRARQVLGRGSTSVPIVLLFTDGDSSESSANLADAVRELPHGSVHVVVLGDALPAQWNTVPVGSISLLADLGTDPGGFEWLLANCLYRSLALEWAGPTSPRSVP
jgi:Mg-chelatase subunit ChlD